MAIYRCEVCYYEYNEDEQGLMWTGLHDGWVCPVCDSSKKLFECVDEPSKTDAVSPTSDDDTERTISDIMVETMVNWGVKHVFGMVGHSNLGLAEAIRKQDKAGSLSFVGIRHEGAAAFAASAYGKLTGRPAACLAIAGPGATNLLTGLWDAKLDRVPVLALTGQVDLQFLGPGSFQEVDLPATFQSVACWSQTVFEGSDHSELMSLALKHAQLKRGVSHLIFPNQIQEVSATANEKPADPTGRLPEQSIQPPLESLEEALGMIRKARKPVLIIGHGSRFCMPQVIKFAEQLQLPVITTFKGKGLIPDSHPLSCGVLGLSGTPIASHFMSDSDLLIVLGASFSKHTGIMKAKPTIQVDFDPMVLGKFHAVTCPLWGEIKTTVTLMLKALVDEAPKVDRRQELSTQWQLWREEKKVRAAESRGRGISSAALFESMGRHVPSDAVIVVDVGNNTYSFGRYFECRSQSILMSGYLGSIGYGYPAAIGAYAAAPDRPVLAVTGDGGFAQYMAELTTAVKYRMPIKHILLNNRELGKISKEQRTDGKTVWSTELHNPDFSRFAKNCGALGVRVDSVEGLDSGLETIFAHDGPAMLEVMTDAELI